MHGAWFGRSGRPVLLADQGSVSRRGDRRTIGVEQDDGPDVQRANALFDFVAIADQQQGSLIQTREACGSGPDICEWRAGDLVGVGLNRRLGKVGDPEIRHDRRQVRRGLKA